MTKELFQPISLTSSFAIGCYALAIVFVLVILLRAAIVGRQLDSALCKHKEREEERRKTWEERLKQRQEEAA